MFRLFRCKHFRYVEFILGPLLLHFRGYAEPGGGPNFGTSVFLTLVDNRLYNTLWYENKRTYAIGWRI